MSNNYIDSTGMPKQSWGKILLDGVFHSKLAILPNGEAIDPILVQAILIEPGVGLATDLNERFDVCIQFQDTQPRKIAEGVLRKDAERISRLCAKAVNDARAIGKKTGGADETG